MIVTARRITDEDVPCPHGPFREIDLAAATHLGVYEQHISRGIRRTLLAKFEGQLWQVKDKDNLEQRRKLLSLRVSRPAPLSRQHTRWTLARLDKMHERAIWVSIIEKYREIVPWGRDSSPWSDYLAATGIKRGSMPWGSHEFAMTVSDPAQELLYSIFLTEDQADKILLLGMP